MNQEIRFSPADWDHTRQTWGSWWAGELDRPLIVIERLRGYDVAPELIPDVVKHAIEYPLALPADEVIDLYSQQLCQTEYYADAFPRWYPDFGPGVGAAFLGSPVEIDTVDHTVWFEVAQAQPIQALNPVFDPVNMWWQRVLSLTQAAVTRWGDQVTVGVADIGGNLDILASLNTTEQLLYDVLEAPDEVVRLQQTITGLWQRYYDELATIILSAGCGMTAWAQMWAPGRFAMLQCDFAVMISPQMFEKFVMPDLAVHCQRLDHAVYHLDGPDQIRHLDHLLSLDDLDGIQWIPGAGASPAEEWLPLLKRIRDADKLCQVYVTPGGARTIVRNLGGQGFCFVIFEELATSDISDFLSTLAQEDISQGG